MVAPMDPGAMAPITMVVAPCPILPAVTPPGSPATTVPVAPTTPCRANSTRRPQSRPTGLTGCQDGFGADAGGHAERVLAPVDGHAQAVQESHQPLARRHQRPALRPRLRPPHPVPRALHVLGTPRRRGHEDVETPGPTEGDVEMQGTKGTWGHKRTQDRTGGDKSEPPRVPEASCHPQTPQMSSW